MYSTVAVPQTACWYRSTQLPAVPSLYQLVQSVDVPYTVYWYQLVSEADVNVLLGPPEIAAVHTLVNVPVVILLR
jgi:hypothetical protein